MKSKIYHSILQVKKYLPLFMLVVLLSSIVIVSFHNHHCDENIDNCAICNFQHLSYSVSVQQIEQGSILQKPLLEFLVILNERVTDPSQKLVCSSHAPPQFS